MIKLDGSHGEGGGQIVRTALALSTVMQQPFEVGNIRKGRKQPGLKAQHLTCLRALKQLCNAKFNEVDIGSTYLKYEPGKIRAKKVEVDIGTAGSITLLLQSLLIPCFFAEHPVALKITGGTSGKWQIPFDYFDNVFLPHLKKYADITAAVYRRGYYPRGGGSVEIKVKPKYSFENRREAQEIELVEQGNLLQIKGISHASKQLQSANVAERQTDAAKSVLSMLGCNIDIRVEYCDTLSPGSGITLWALFSKDAEPDELNPAIIGSDALGEKGKPAEDVGTEAAKNLVNEINIKAAVDEHLADNLIPFLALFGGQMRVTKISRHTMTNIYVAEQFLGRIFKVDEKENRIICEP